MYTKQDRLDRIDNQIAANKRRRLALKEQNALLRKEREQVEQRRELPEPRTSVISFDKQYASYSQTYKFAAVRVGTDWYVTGAQSPQRLTWRQLAEFIAKDNRLPVEYVQRPMGDLRTTD